MSDGRASLVRFAGQRARRRRRAAGLTLLEIMIVLAIIAMGTYLGFNAFRMATHAQLAEEVNDLSAVLRRAQVLAVEAGMPMRIVFDFDKQGYWVEACAGDPTLKRAKEEEKADTEAQQEALEQARQRLATLPGGQIPAASAEEEAKIATALAGKSIGGRVCTELGIGASAELGQIMSLDAEGRDFKRKFSTGKGVKLREVWAQHLDQSATAGQVSLTFFPLGWAEKAIIEIGDDDEHVYSILIHGLTGRIEIRDGALSNPDDHMLRNARGDKTEER